LQVRSLPAVFVLDRQGRVVEVWAGDVDAIASEIEGAVQRGL
jgi:hypothetical protein